MSDARVGSAVAADAKPLTIRDEIHGDMVFDPMLRLVIDHESFQRLRFIKQLGLAEYVFPCANHTRFQHSLGAAYLAGQYFQSMIHSWSTAPFSYEGTTEGTRFYAGKTRDCVRAVASHPKSEEFWSRVVSLAGMLHDVGHGPWSHTFEYLDLKQDFEEVTRRMQGTIGEYFRALTQAGNPLQHEDLSVIYIFHILCNLGERGLIPDWRRYVLPIVALVNRRVALGREQAFEQELGRGLTEAGVQGGVDFHRLLRPMISGPFDVDRIDYIQRDGRNCGVSIGGIEWRRIVGKLIPCLADHQGKETEPRDVVLISNIKNQHVLDDFIFSLFQMYAQVYLHPKIVGLEESIREQIEKSSSAERGRRITFEMHRQLTDAKFREMLNTELGVPQVESLLLRRPGYHFKVASFPENHEVEASLRRQGFRLIDLAKRPMMKDSVGVFLYSSTKPPEQTYFLSPWERVSPVAGQFFSIHYSPRIWLKPEVPAN